MSDMIKNGVHGCTKEEKYTYPSDPVIRERRVQARNKAALHLAKERGLAVIDLYTPSLEGALHKEDGVHFQDAGYCVLARVLLDGVRGLIGKNEAIYPHNGMRKATDPDRISRFLALCLKNGQFGGNVGAFHFFPCN